MVNDTLSNKSNKNAMKEVIFIPWVVSLWDYREEKLENGKTKHKSFTIDMSVLGVGNKFHLFLSTWIQLKVLNI